MDNPLLYLLGNMDDVIVDLNIKNLEKNYTNFVF